MCAFVCACSEEGVVLICLFQSCAWVVLFSDGGVELGGWLRSRSTQPRMLFLCVNDTSACHLLS